MSQPLSPPVTSLPMARLQSKARTCFRCENGGSLHLNESAKGSCAMYDINVQCTICLPRIFYSEPTKLQRRNCWSICSEDRPAAGQVNECFCRAAFAVMRCLSRSRDIIKMFSPSDSHAILVYLCQTA